MGKIKLTMNINTPSYNRMSTNIAYNSSFKAALKIQREEEKRTLTADTPMRRDVYNIIKTMLSEGKGKQEILSCLNEKYGDSSISQYFDQYIEHQVKKLNMKSNEKDGEER